MYNASMQPSNSDDNQSKKVTISYGNDVEKLLQFLEPLASKMQFVGNKMSESLRVWPLAVPVLLTSQCGIDGSRPFLNEFLRPHDCIRSFAGLETLDL
ncbi:hypothetical protein PRIPAC_83688 [Pristionchus pacificus]|uniref:Uncharacterized protein n=1 Tax=Pristionchus pacificus TaxID=54126 RepID=A0A2A6BMB7_PRIPA|nr:hypothetical protein PRIPAC_83688 [Pristionchus pacificus]|eukprot:PDM66946.1 hypothetical protein PRIPAC_48363 [Pristionchus pacificus]